MSERNLKSGQAAYFMIINGSGFSSTGLDSSSMTEVPT